MKCKHNTAKIIGSSRCAEHIWRRKICFKCKEKLSTAEIPVERYHALVESRKDLDRAVLVLENALTKLKTHKQEDHDEN